MIDSKICPICKKENSCKAHISPSDCWCNYTPIPQDLREYIPKKYKMKACICKECVSLFVNDKEAFISKYSQNY